MSTLGLMLTRCLSTAASTEKFIQKSVRVAVLGASSHTGQALCLMLKQNPLISSVYMYDKCNTVGLATDLRHLDTRTEITGFSDKDLNLAIRNADVIVTLGVDKLSKESLIKDRMKAEGLRLVSLATTCATFAPKAIFVDCVFPVSVTLPLVSEIYRRNHWYHPGRVVGSVSLLQIRLNTMLARHLDLDPSSVHVPLLGGADDDTILPLFSRASPAPVPLTEAKVLVNRFRALDDDASPTENPKNKIEYCPYSNAFSINRFVTTIALGLLGDNNAISTAHVRSNFVTNCRHIVSTVKFGKHGVVHNYGVPRLTKFELQVFEKVTLELERREKFAREFLLMTDNIRAPDTEAEAYMTERLFFPSRVEPELAASD